MRETPLTFSVYILGTAPQLALGKGKRRVSEKPGLLSWGGGGVALVLPSTQALRPPPQPHVALAWELLSVSTGVVSGS